MEVGGEGEYIIYTYRHTVTTRMTPASRWAAISAVSVNVSLNVRAKVTETVSTDHTE